MKKLLKSLTFNPRQLLRHHKKSSSSVSKSSPLSSFTSTTSSTTTTSSSSSKPPRSPSSLVDRKELESLLRRLGERTAPISDEEISGMVDEIDSDGDGLVTLDELEKVGANVGSSEEEELREAFEFFDADGDGRITAEELREVFVALGDEGCTLEECRCMIQSVDRNKDGFVCFEDFAIMMDLSLNQR